MAHTVYIQLLTSDGHSYGGLQDAGSFQVEPTRGGLSGWSCEDQVTVDPGSTERSPPPKEGEKYRGIDGGVYDLTPIVNYKATAQLHSVL